MAICILLHWMLKLSISLFKCIDSLMLVLSCSSVLHVSPAVFSACRTGWRMPLPDSASLGASCRCGQPCGQPEAWHAAGLRVRLPHTGSQQSGKPTSAGKARPLLQKTFQQLKRNYIHNPTTQTELFMYFCGSSQSLSVCIQSLYLYNFLVYFPPSVSIISQKGFFCFN